MTPLIKADSTVLFQGDSITDAGRNRTDPANLGSGYAMIASAWFGALYPGLNVKFINRGIGGDRTGNLRERWQTDCLDLKPDWISILVGINDTWRRYDSETPTSTQTFEDNYRALLETTRKNLDSKIILAEPFVLPTPPDRRTWREDLDPKIEAVHRLAKDFDAILLPFDQIFAEAQKGQEAAYWAGDGVHPSPAGHGLMAQSWLKAVEAL